MQTKLAQYLVALGELSAARQAQLILAERLEAAEPACEGNEPSQVKGRLLLAKTVYGQQQTLMDNLRAQGSMVGQNTLSAAQQQLNALRAELQSVEAEYGRCRALLQTLDAQAREQHTRTDSAEQSAEEIRRYYQSMREAFGAQLGPYQAAVQAVAKPQ
jgi:chromosome segregation ATPase